MVLDRWRVGGGEVVGKGAGLTFASANDKGRTCVKVFIPPRLSGILVVVEGWVGDGIPKIWRCLDQRIGAG